MVFIKNIFLLFLIALISSSCQLGYIAESAYYQAQLMRQRVPLSYALENYQLTKEQRSRLELTIEIRKFMADTLKLNTRSNYKRYVHLDRDYVSYAVNAAEKDQLKSYTWSFPIIGSVPYKAYFKKESALEEAQELEKENLDVYIRGVSAYSTLGWFEDPLLSSMLSMKEHDFINTLIHETIHANLYIGSESKFNERIATFLGQLGTEAYFQHQGRLQELEDIVAKEAHDELLFSQFITDSLKDLRAWYKAHQDSPDLLDEREIQFEKMKKSFTETIVPKMKTKNYHWFSKKKLNNAFLMLLELYNSDFSYLEKLANFYNRDFQKVFNALKKLEDSDNPEKDLQKLVSNLNS